jgi:AraC-like DNA-binding protein
LRLVAVHSGLSVIISPLALGGVSMDSWTSMLTASAVAIALLSLLALIRQKTKRNSEVLFAVVSGSLALSLMSPWMGTAPEWMKWAIAIGGSATCNGFWLVSRALFRGEHGVRFQHILLAAGVALLIAIHRGTAMQPDATPSVLTVAIDTLLVLTSTSLLALSFIEPLLGWSSKWSYTERRLRLMFMTVYGGCVLSTSLLGELAHAFPALAPWRAGAVALCASVMIVFTHLAFRHRRDNPAPSDSRDRCDPTRQVVAPCESDAQLAAQLRHHLEVLQVYREPELRVAELAARLEVPEYRLSRFITRQLGKRNFNQLLNQYRVAHACKLLAMPAGFENILRVSGESGFASLGPFNRAFKSIMGCTPSEYRAAKLKTAPETEYHELPAS